MIGLIILAIILLVIGIIFIAKNLEENGDHYQSSLGTTLIFISGFFIGYVIFTPSIKAIDVYRGKTKLQIEEKVINNVVVSTDTTVILK